jgi:type IX secretion system PorP/SprF family membrane protein
LTKLDIFASRKKNNSLKSLRNWDNKSGMKFSHLRYTIVLCFLFTAAANAQQYPIYSQYAFNAFLLNPAVAGHEGYTALNLTVREQWVGLKDAPSTYAITGQTRLLKNSFISRSKSVRHRKRVMSRSGRVGFGGYIFNDVNGAFSRLGFQGTYAYHLTLRRSQLSLGVSLSTFRYKVDRDKIRLEDMTDETYQSILVDDKRYITDGNAGIYYSNRYIFAGASVQNLFESFFKFNNREGAGFKLERQYLMMAGYRFDLIDFLFIEPSFLLKVSELSIVQTDINVKCYYKEDYWGGISYRTGSGSRVSQETIAGKGSSLIFMGGARVDKFYFGYSFDYTFSSISKRTYGSHELMIAVKFGDSARRYRWLNRY